MALLDRGFGPEDLLVGRHIQGDRGRRRGLFGGFGDSRRCCRCVCRPWSGRRLHRGFWGSCRRHRVIACAQTKGVSVFGSSLKPGGETAPPRAAVLTRMARFSGANCAARVAVKPAKALIEIATPLLNNIRRSLSRARPTFFCAVSSLTPSA